MAQIFMCWVAALVYLVLTDRWPYSSLGGKKPCRNVSQLPHRPPPPPPSTRNHQALKRQAAIAHLTHLESAQALLQIDASIAAGTAPTPKYGAPSLSKPGPRLSTTAAHATPAAGSLGAATAPAKSEGVQQ
jgi:hypothetical protein